MQLPYDTLAPTSKTPYAALKCPDRYCDNISATVYLIEKKLISSLKMRLDNYELNIQKAVIKRIKYIKETKNTRRKRDIDNFNLGLYPIMPYKQGL